jgi:hypothetical protein
VTQLFDRTVRLAIDDLAYEDIRVDFEVKKTLSSEPNNAKLKVYNLNEDRRQMVLSRRSDVLIRLEAGYSAPRLIFQGAPKEGGVKIKDKGVDRVLVIEAQDGLTEYQNARIFQSFDAGIKVEDVARRAADEFDLPIRQIDVPSDRELTQGVTLNGRSADVLDRIAGQTDASWSIQDGELQFLPKDATSTRTATVFSSKNGNLIGQPEPKDNGVSFKGLLDGTVNPGDEVKLESRDFKGVYKAHEVSYKGSRYSSKFYVNLLVKEV